MSRPSPSGMSGQPAMAGVGPRMAGHSAQTNLSFAERKAQKASPRSPPRLVEGNHLMRDIDRPPPGDVIHRGVNSSAQKRSNLAKKRSNLDFFADTFAGDQSSSSWARDRVHGDAIVMAEVKTNVIISDEYTFITELSYHLSTRYQRPVSSIVVTLQHGACMFFAGSFDAAYVMSVFALPSQLLPTTNKRNAALIQKHMHEATGVAPARGLLRFVPAQEEHLACNGRTMAGEIEELEKGFSHRREHGGGVGDGGYDGPVGVMPRGSKSGSTRASVGGQAAGMPAPETTTPSAGSADGSLPPVPGSPVLPLTLATTTLAGEEYGTRLPPEPRTARRKKSFVAGIFGRSGGKSLAYRSSLSPISDER